MNKLFFSLSILIFTLTTAHTTNAADVTAEQYNVLQQANDQAVQNTKEYYDPSMDVLGEKNKDPDSVFTYDANINDGDEDDELEENSTYNDTIIRNTYPLDGNARIIIQD